MAQSQSSKKNGAVSETTTFLLVEDDLNDVLMVEMEFKRAPVQIRLVSVNDGDEAMRYLEGQGDYRDRRKYPMPDVVLLDLKMRRVGGFQFLQWLRSGSPRQHRFIPVVVMSS